ncbi:hypothetical protein TRFO_39784 [Tritrichomonas foetus]|uniref:ATPase, AAA family protein n=1 Tax=Tritrichomonas foetus TaxID=1144522 RepID=A0A1J4J5V4_9EUKA|nr:hypothetical protein TRFO_39784 [Tritrichomonas foetus]|eukprot:OHS94041.1 hypothetical protein TRFO_39784 [Tritrichomonas foetus]
MTTIQLIVDRVLEPTDFHVYLHPSKMAALNLTDGMIVRIRSRMRKTILASAYTGDGSIPVSTIRMSRCLRINLSAFLGQIVIVDAFSKCVPADSVTVAPIDDTVDGLAGNFQDIFNANLVSLPMTPNFVIPVFALHRIIEFKVMSCTPANFVIVRNRASIIIKNQTVTRARDMKRYDEISYDDFGGIEPQLRDLRSAIELPILQPNIYETFGIKTFRGILLSAPSGCGKTHLSRAIQNESPCHFERIPGLDLLARNAEDASVIMRKLADRAIAKAPSIVFVDELDVIIQDQYINGNVDKRLFLAFIAALDMMLARGNIVVIAATRDSTLIPQALKNVNRFAQIIEIPPPGREKKLEILHKMTRGMKIDNDTLEKFAESSNSPGDLEKRVFEELLTKAFEFSSTRSSLNQSALDEGPFQLTDISSIEFGNASALGLNKELPAGSPDSFGDFSLNSNPFQSNTTPTNSKIMAGDPFNTNANSTGNMNNANVKNSDDPFANIGGDDIFGGSSQQNQRNSRNPFAMSESGSNNNTISEFDEKPPVNDPFAQNDMFGRQQQASGGNKMGQIESADPFAQSHDPPKKSTAKKAGKIDPFAPRIKK